MTEAEFVSFMYVCICIQVILYFTMEKEIVHLSMAKIYYLTNIFQFICVVHYKFGYISHTRAKASF